VNLKLGRVACRIGEGLGASCKLIDPREYELPIYDGDLEEKEGLPPGAVELKKAFEAADGLLFCSPEYNSSITPLLKNLIDWVSRPASGDEAPLSAYRGKVAGLVSASPGGLGGMRGLVHLRSILGNIGVHVVPAQYALAGAYGKFDDSGELTDEEAVEKLTGVMKQLVETTRRLSD
jgi:NAD(P)H-dependent FMN reductase